MAYPSTAHYDKTGKYVHDPLNQTLAEHEAQGHLGPRDIGQLKHNFGAPGYCEAHLELGCLLCR